MLISIPAGADSATRWAAQPLAMAPTSNDRWGSVIKNGGIFFVQKYVIKIGVCGGLSQSVLLGEGAGLPGIVP
jgi:hypothetical protein